MKHNYLLAIAMTLLASCSSDLHDNPDCEPDTNKLTEISVTLPDLSPNVTQSKAIDVAMIFAQRNNPLSRSSERSVKEILTIPDNDGNPMMYVVNFQNDGGFVIVSASKKYYPIIAHNDTGNYHISDNCESPSDYFLNDKMQYIKACETLSDEETSEFSNQWHLYDNETQTITRSRADDIPQVYYDSLIRWSTDPNITVYRYNDYSPAKTPEQQKEIETAIHYWGNSNYGTVEDVTLIVVENSYDHIQKILLSTQWGQSGGYAQYTPYHWPVGCCAVAAGQVMRFYQYPTYYNWDAMLNTEPNDYTAKFLADIGSKMDMNYGPYGSSSTILKVQQTLENEGYSTSLVKHDTEKVISEINAFRPVIMRGVNINDQNESTGHEWVCDGLFIYRHFTKIRIMTLEYRPTTYSIPTTMVEAYTLIQNYHTHPTQLHMNWGWEGLNDGFFDDSNILVNVNGESKKYDNDRWNLIKIKPKK